MAPNNEPVKVSPTDIPTEPTPAEVVPDPALASPPVEALSTEPSSDDQPERKPFPGEDPETVPEGVAPVDKTNYVREQEEARKTEGEPELVRQPFPGEDPASAE